MSDIRLKSLNLESIDSIKNYFSKLNSDELSYRVIEMLDYNKIYFEEIYYNDSEHFSNLKKTITDEYERRFMYFFNELASDSNSSNLAIFLTMHSSGCDKKDILKNSTLTIFNDCELRISNYLNSLKKKEGCYIATMAYGDYDHPQVLELRKFRDDFLSKTKLGRSFIKLYYQYSPSLVEILKNKQGINLIIRKFLDQCIKTIKK